MKLFVAGLPFDLNDQELQEMFEAYGTVGSAKVIMDRETGKSRGFGFVEFPTDSEAEAAIKALNGGTLEGRELTVKLAEDSQEAVLAVLAAVADTGAVVVVADTGVAAVAVVAVVGIKCWIISVYHKQLIVGE